MQVLQKRYGADPLAGSAEDFIVAVAGAMQAEAMLGPIMPSG